MLALIATALVPYWDQGEVSTYVAGELANYATSSSVTSAISSALSSYDNSSQVDSKIITALLDFYTRTEVDQQIANGLGERGSEQLLHAGRDAELRGERAARVLPSDRAGFPAHGHVHPVLDQLANPNRDRRRHRRRRLPDPSAGRHALLRANGSFESLVRTNVTPPQIKALLPGRPWRPTPSSRTPRSSSPATPTPRRSLTGGT